MAQYDQLTALPFKGLKYLIESFMWMMDGRKPADDLQMVSAADHPLLTNGTADLHLCMH